MCCGCFSIAANNGGVSDFFNSDNGILIDSPNIVANWVKSFKDSFELMNKNYQVQSFENQILSNDEWCLKFAQVFDKWERRLKSNT
jgi:L-malate glycosyltransferase